MNNLCVDLGWRSINKYGEQLCGDHVEIVDREDGSLVVIDWADAHLAPAWYELGPLAFELFQGQGELLRLFAGADQEAFVERLLDCCCLHDFGADFLWNFWQREGAPEFGSLEEVRKLLEKKLAGAE